MSKTPNFDAKVKAILDGLTPGERTCALTGEAWTMDQTEIDWYKKFNVPPSHMSPLSRLKLVDGYFVVFDMWYNKHAESGKPVVSIVHPATGIRVLPDTEWFSKDFIDRGQSLDLLKPFFDQLHQLVISVPVAATYNYQVPENSIAFISLGDQDSYFVLACRSKRTLYAMNGYDVEDSAELTLVNNVRESYNVCHSDRVYKCRFVREAYDCIEGTFLFDCRNCEFCFGATNQRNKKYLFFNEQLTREDWEHRVAAIDLTSFAVREEYEKRFRDLVSNAVWPENFNIGDENSTGDYIYESTNCKDGYFITRGCKDLDACSYAFNSPSNNCYLSTAIFGSSDCYYGIGAGNSSQCRFALSILNQCFDTEYCNSCYNCEHCFGCVGLRHKKFCILNKQYTEEEYWKVLDELKRTMLDRGEYGEMPPLKLSTQHWKGSGAALVYGATKDECAKLGALDFEAAADGAEGPEIDPALLRSLDTLPDRVEAAEDLVGKPYWDAAFGRRFTYLKPELDLYQKLGVAPSRKHPTRRIRELYAEMNIAVFENAHCEKCHQVIRVAKNMTYPNRRLYCRSCYRALIDSR